MGDIRKISWINKSRGYFGISGIGGEFELKEFNQFAVFGHPIRIGDVLEKIRNEGIVYSKNDSMEILDLWRPCGFNKPLQELLECGWEAKPNVNKYKSVVSGEERKIITPVEQLKSPAVNELMCYLYELFIK